MLDAEGPIFAYRARLSAGEWTPDPAQELAVEKLQTLHNRLRSYRAVKGATWLERLRRDRREPPPEGLYLYGGVGRGKSVLMDLFYASAPIARKRRAHFHAFMLDVHARIHAWRQREARERADDDPIRPVAKALAEEATLLCLDELQVSDVADAMILRRLFAKLFQNGMVVVTTSNTAPDDLYAGGLNRELFMPFIELIETGLDVMCFNGARDYRLDRLRGAPVTFVPLGPETDAALDAAFVRLADGAAAVPLAIAVKGRRLELAAAGGIARSTFEALCGRALGAADYLEVARQFHTVLLAGVPMLGPERIDEARRFINLIDILYEHRVNLLCGAAAAPDRLYDGARPPAAFARTVSRIEEMQSDDYLAAPHLG